MNNKTKGLKNNMETNKPGSPMLGKTENEIRIALRVPADVHQQIRRRANEERLSINQAIVRAMEKFAGCARAEVREEIRDLLDVCKVMGGELGPEAKRALTERVKSVYGLDLLADFYSSTESVGRGARSFTTLSL